jgi:hypothetical protein
LSTPWSSGSWEPFSASSHKSWEKKMVFILINQTSYLLTSNYDTCCHMLLMLSISKSHKINAKSLLELALIPICWKMNGVCAKHSIASKYLILLYMQENTHTHTLKTKFKLNSFTISVLAHSILLIIE